LIVTIVLRTAVLWEQVCRGRWQVVYRQAILPVEELKLDQDRDPVEQLKERMRPERQRLDPRQAAVCCGLQVAADAQGLANGMHCCNYITLFPIMSHWRS